MTCYICDPTNPEADEEGCTPCEREAFGLPRETSAWSRAKRRIAVTVYCPECLRFRFQPAHLRHCRRRRVVRSEVSA